jgi:hypothetical protein
MEYKITLAANVPRITVTNALMKMVTNWCTFVARASGIIAQHVRRWLSALLVLILCVWIAHLLMIVQTPLALSWFAKTAARNVTCATRNGATVVKIVHFAKIASKDAALTALIWREQMECIIAIFAKHIAVINAE